MSAMKSQSVLTRRLFQAIVANRPYHSASCPLRTITTTPPNGHSRRHDARQQQRRGLFGIAIGSMRPEHAGSRSGTKNVETALEKLSDYIHAKKTRSRPPPHQELVEALRFFVSARNNADQGLIRNELYLVSETAQYLIQEKWVSDNDAPRTLDATDLLTLMGVLRHPTPGSGLHRNDIQELAAVLNVELNYHDGTAEQGQVLLASALANSGAAEKALRLLQQSKYQDNEAWSHILRGLLMEGHKEQLWPILQSTDFKMSEGTSEVVFSSLIRYASACNDPETAQRVLQIALSRGYQPDVSALVLFLQTCVDSGKVGQGDAAAELLRSELGTAGVPGSLLSWRAAHGASVDELGQAMQVMLNEGADITMAEMNQLVKHAYSAKAAHLAESYIQLAQSVGAVPDALTYALKLDHDLSQGDLAAAREAFEGMSIQDVPDVRLDVPVLNRYIAKLASEDGDYQHINRVVDSLIQTGGILEADTLAALTLLFLQKDETTEVLNLLRPRINLLAGPDRAKIATIFKQYITKPDVKDQNAFRAYDIFRNAFPELPPTEKLPIIDTFFERNRSDLACLVFAHMRSRQGTEARPDDAIYAHMFYGIAKCRDVDGLQQVYNMLKVDVSVEQTTKIRNSMMAAYTACQTPFSAIIDHYWKILDSREGPTLSTFKLALRACEAWVGAGGEEARRIMALMQKWNLIITKDIYECYIGALAGQSQFENVIELIERMEEDIGEAPDAVTIGTFYNTIPWQYRKDEVEAWARKAYPQLWEDLVAMGDEIDEEWEVRYFNVNRDIEIDDELLFGGGQYSPELAASIKLQIPEPVKEEKGYRD